MGPPRCLFLVLLIYLGRLEFGAGSRATKINYRLLNEHDSERHLDSAETPNTILEADFSDDDDLFVEIDMDPLNRTAYKLVLANLCSRCDPKHNPNCEHDVRPGNLKQIHHFSLNVERLLRRSRTTPSKDAPICLPNDPELQMFQRVKGTVELNGACNPNPNGHPMCKHFDTTDTGVTPSHSHCFFSTKMSCKKLNGTGRCEQASPAVTGWLALEHFNVANGCLNDVGTKYYKDQVLPMFKSEDGKRLHNERCEPFDDAPPDERCMLVSDHAVQNYTLKSKPRCSKPTHLKCHPIFKKCICASEEGNSSEIHFQFGNRSHICFIRPTMPWKPGFTCGGRSKSQYLHGTIACRCKVTSRLPYFNSKCRQWWICKGSRLVSPNILVVLLLIALAKYSTP